MEAGPFWWPTDPVKGWRLGAWVHEVGHNFHGVTNMARIASTSATWADVFFHHGMEFTQILAKERMASTPQAFGSQVAYENFMAWVEYERSSNLDQAQDYIDWLQQGGRAINYTGGGQYKVWSTMCQTLCDQYGTNVLENTVRAVRYDGLPQSVYDTADTDLKRNTLLFCIVSNSAGADLRSFFDAWGFDVDNAFYEQIEPTVGQIISHLVRDEDHHGWKRYPGNGHFYTLIPWMIQWHEAERYARRSQGHLVTIRSEEEEQWLSNRFSVKGNIWIGLTDEFKEGHWQWTSGEALGYTNWNANEPNGGKNENYVGFRWGVNKGWNDSSGPTRRWALIERDSFPIPNPGDFDDNGSVNLSDFAMFSAVWLSSSTDERSKDRYDLEVDGVIDLKDLSTFARHWGNKY